MRDIRQQPCPIEKTLTSCFRWSVAEIFGFISFATAIGVGCVDIRLAVLPLTVFLILCVVAPFFVRFSYYLPIISRGRSGKNAVALTFDDGPDPVSTPELLRLLAKYNIKATFFVTGDKARQYPELIDAIVREGHAVGNHSYSHDIFIMFKGRRTLRYEIETTQQVLQEHGIRSLAFRPPVGITNPLLHHVLCTAGMYVVNFSCRAIDVGNRRIRQLSQKILKTIRPDDIVVLHDIRPRERALFKYWLNELDLLFSGIEAKGMHILPLSEIIGRPVMIKI